jgi:hypothetical protein
MRLSILHPVLASIMVLRALWAFCLFVLMNLFLLGIVTPQGVSASWENLSNTITIPQTVVWGIYVFGYLLAAYMFIKRRETSMLVFAGAMILDFGLWLYVTTDPEYGFVWSDIGRTIDLFLDGLDIVIWVLLVFFVLKKGLVQPPEQSTQLTGTGTGKPVPRTVSAA